MYILSGHGNIFIKLDIYKKMSYIIRGLHWTVQNISLLAWPLPTIGEKKQTPRRRRPQATTCDAKDRSQQFGSQVFRHNARLCTCSIGRFSLQLISSLYQSLVNVSGEGNDLRVSTPLQHVQRPFAPNLLHALAAAFLDPSPFSLLIVHV
jgi:hypothetical protein